jgi:murein DD-endopeptidase MepM/ murein hydrolase activator NlpD
MRRRSRLAVTFVALVTVGWSAVTSQPSGSALAADPAAQLAETRAQLADAQSAQQTLAATLERQRAELTQLQGRSADLDVQLDIARAELEAVTAEFNRVSALLAEVRAQVLAIEAHLADLRAQIDALDAELVTVANDVNRRTADLLEREALLEDHLRSAYERSQTSLLEVLLSADSLDEATAEVGYLMTVSDQDTILAEDIRAIREELETRRATLKEGRRGLADARAVARDEEDMLNARRDELTALEALLAELRAAAEVKQADQEAALNAALQAQGDVEAQIAANEEAAAAMERLAAQLAQQAAAQEQAIEEARRRAAAEAAARAAAEAAARDEASRAEAARRNATSTYGFRWPERSFQVTQEWGPTGFVLEPPYTYGGTYYPHFHAGIDFAGGCGTPIYSTGAGVVVASGQPLWPFDSGYGVVVDHGSGIQSWYWHMQPNVVVGPGTIVTSESVIGYEGSTGMSTGCHVHFAVNHGGVWENPRAYLP